MTDTTNFRKERIEKLLNELRFEIEHGVAEQEIDETISFQFYVPISRSIPNGVVFCEFSTRPMNPVLHPQLRINNTMTLCDKCRPMAATSWEQHNKRMA